ncbi:MAG: helix-turn-helix transcriptional regulator [Anaerovoracaceae bacterium]
MREKLIRQEKVFATTEEERRCGLNLLANEQKLVQMVEEGALSEVKKYLAENREDYVYLYQRISLSKCKYYFCITAGQMARSAERAGVEDWDAIERLGNYLSQVEGMQEKKSVYALLCDMVEDFCIQSQNRILTEKPGHYFRQCLEYVQIHIYEGITVQDVADYAQVSRSTLTRWFQQHIGMTPSAYIQAYRITRAEDLLRHSSLSISEISQLLGFADQPHFQNCFRKTAGMTPWQYRHQNRDL